MQTILEAAVVVVRTESTAHPEHMTYTHTPPRRMDALTHHPLNSLRLHRTDDLEGCHTKSPCFSLEGLILPQASSRGTPSIVLLAVSIRVLLTGSTFFFVAPRASHLVPTETCWPPAYRQSFVVRDGSFLPLGLAR